MTKDTEPTPPNDRQTTTAALIVDSTIASKYVYDLAEWGQSQSNFKITHLIIQAPRSSHPSSQSHRRPQKSKALETAQKAGLAAITKLESFLINRDAKYQSHLIKKDITEHIKNRISTTPSILTSDQETSYQYAEDDIKKIKDLNLDILINCCQFKLRGGISRSTKFGVISLHHADDRIHRGVPPGFWEVFFKHDSTGFTILQQATGTDEETVLFRGRIATRFFYLLNQAALYEKSNLYLKKVLSDIASRHTPLQKLDSTPYFNSIKNTPNLRTQSVYAMRLAITIARKVANKLFVGKKYRWGVAFKSGSWQNLVMQRGTRIKNPPNHFLADPFVINHNGENFCFLEDYDYHISRGYISVYKLHEDSSEKIGDAIMEPFHLSYPFIFKYQSKYYICPETSENKDIRLYECEKFPLDWRFKKTIMSNISAVDTTIFEKDGIWWLFTNIDPADSGDHCYELSLFYADNPLTDNWTPHPKNPILVDSMKARMGGLLFDNDFIYRVSQQQAFDQYGKRSIINKITHLSKTDYKEETLASIEPSFFENLSGTHHMHSNGEITVFDYNQIVKPDF